MSCFGAPMHRQLQETYQRSCALYIACMKRFEFDYPKEFVEAERPKIQRSLLGFNGRCNSSIGCFDSNCIMDLGLISSTGTQSCRPCLMQLLQ